MNINIPAFAYLITVWSILVALFWMYVGWKAMRAHEKIATAVDEMSFVYRSKD